MDELRDAILGSLTPVFNPYDGVEIGEGSGPEAFQAGLAVRQAIALGLEAPRFCQICGRKLVVQIRPDGWEASCSRHGSVDSDVLQQR